MSKRKAWKWIAAVTLVVLLVIAMLAYITAPVMADTGPAGTEAAAVTEPGDSIEPGQMWAWVVSLAVPFVTGLVVRKSWPNIAKLGVALGTSVIIGVVTVWISGQWGGGAWVTVAGCFVVAQATFSTIVNPTPLKDWLYRRLNHDPVLASE